MVIKGRGRLRHGTKKISLYSLSVMCATCLYQLESPWGLIVHIVSELSQQINGQQINVIYNDLRDDIYWF
jgi:hypothetical protein